MNYFLFKYGVINCVEIFGARSTEMPRGELKVIPDLPILGYIKTLNIGDELNLV